jgi:hypothetical protein
LGQANIIVHKICASVSTLYASRYKEDTLVIKFFGVVCTQTTYIAQDLWIQFEIAVANWTAN